MLISRVSKKDKKNIKNKIKNANLMPIPRHNRKNGKMEKKKNKKGLNF